MAKQKKAKEQLPPGDYIIQVIDIQPIKGSKKNKMVTVKVLAGLHEGETISFPFNFGGL